LGRARGFSDEHILMKSQVLIHVFCSMALGEYQCLQQTFGDYSTPYYHTAFVPVHCYDYVPFIVGHQMLHKLCMRLSSQWLCTQVVVH
jgi:muramidase (phage lysozyme)